MSLLAAAVLAAQASAARARIEELFAAFNRHDVAALSALYVADARLTSSDFCTPRTARDVPRTYGALFEAFPDIRDELDTIIIEGDRAAVRFVSHSETPGRAFRLTLVTLFEFKNGKIAADETVFDNAGRPCEP